ncbi:LacI family DNA-binding transcriptional regulator [Microbacter sp. GSS18]|nr:LacI family DNA-binding transcriptional regulator [Microbacter sp. GSS18]
MASNENVLMRDVAQRAGVGVATVSRALSGAPGVSPVTRARIQEIARAMGYVVSPEASRLAKGVTGRVAVVVPHVSRWFFGAVVEGIERVLGPTGTDVLLYQVPDEASRHRFFSELPARRKVDGAIVVGIPIDTDEERALHTLGVQIVTVSGIIVSGRGDTSVFPSVRVDDAAAARQAAAHLLALGHRRIGVIGSREPTIPEWFVDIPRAQGFSEALTEAGHPLEPEMIVNVDWNPENAARAAGRLLSASPPPTAVFAHSDELAVAVMRTIRRAGLRVPEDISVMGVDDHPIAALTDLTTIAQPAAEQGEEAATMMLDLLAGRETETQVLLPTMLVPRGSTARPR